MVAWMLYLTGVGAAMGLAGLIAERGLRHLGRPVRWCWLAAMVATVLLPISLAVVTGSTGASGVGGVLESAPAVGVGPTTDMALLAGWFAVSLVLLANVRLSAWTLRRNERFWRSEWLGRERVLLSSGFGPGVIGASWPRIVLPEWVLEAAPSLKHHILMHELEHVRARDTRLLLAGVALVLLVPWCLPLWWQLHRLRGAVETDCDARVVAATGDPRGYANALVSVAGRRRGSLLPVATLAPARGELERRIHLITAGARERSKRSGLALLFTALAGIVGLSTVPVPSPPTPNVEFPLEAVDWSVADVPGEARVMLTVEGERPDEVLTEPGERPR